MTQQFVQFTDATETVVCSVYGSPQDPVAHPNQGVVDSTDPRVVLFLTPPAPPALPMTATPLQFRLGLSQAGIRAAVEAWIPTASQAVQDAYKYASVFVETDSLVTGTAAQFNLTTEQVHALFITMQTLSP